jgi:Fe-S-cluster containining protein
MKKEAEQIAAATLQPISAFAVKVQDKAPYSFELRKTTKEGECVFLKNNRCAIYSLRPLICWFYPLELKTAGNRKHEFLYSSECPGVGKGRVLRESDFERLFHLAHVKARAEYTPNGEKG